MLPRLIVRSVMIAIGLTYISLYLTDSAWGQEVTFSIIEKTNYYDRCEGDVCDDGKRAVRETEITGGAEDRPCGPVAVRNVQIAMCGKVLSKWYQFKAIPWTRIMETVNPLLLWIRRGREINQALGMTEANIKKSLKKAWGYPCPNGTWKSYDPPPGDKYIRFLRRVTKGKRVALALVQPGAEISDLHWYLVESVTGRGSRCTVWVKDSPGRASYSCTRFAEMAAAVPQILDYITNNDIVYFDPDP